VQDNFEIIFWLQYLPHFGNVPLTGTVTGLRDGRLKGRRSISAGGKAFLVLTHF
jgi:hypothetical protein